MVLFCIRLSYVNISTFIAMHLSTSAHHTQHEMRHLNLQCIPCLIVRNSSVFVFVYQLHYFFHLHVVTWHCTHTPRSLNDDGHTHTHTRALACFLGPVGHRKGICGRALHAVCVYPRSLPSGRPNAGQTPQPLCVARAPSPSARAALTRQHTPILGRPEGKPGPAPADVIMAGVLLASGFRSSIGSRTLGPPRPVFMVRSRLRYRRAAGANHHIWCPAWGRS